MIIFILSYEPGLDFSYGSSPHTEIKVNKQEPTCEKTFEQKEENF